MLLSVLLNILLLLNTIVIPKIIVLLCKLIHRTVCSHHYLSPHYKPKAGHCACVKSLLRRCRELSYNQIENLPSFYHCSSLQEMWVIWTDTTCIHQDPVLSSVWHCMRLSVGFFLNRGLQHNQIRKIESSTFQQLTALRVLWVKIVRHISFIIYFGVCHLRK